ncbi:unnamed protein product [Coffea canephora]|uniref:Uncharacterized protein n=1 Tax=Coffea canephora TaxID=49390 RepID=A0A068UD34_COFCA|nr:unnamed protein product [Coffea canephora]
MLLKTQIFVIVFCSAMQANLSHLLLTEKVLSRYLYGCFMREVDRWASVLLIVLASTKRCKVKEGVICCIKDTYFSLLPFTCIRMTTFFSLPCSQ